MKARPDEQRPAVTFAVWIQIRASFMGLQRACLLLGTVAVQILWLLCLLLPFWLGLRRCVSHLLKCRVPLAGEVRVCLSQTNGAHQGMGLTGLAGSVSEL